MKTKIIMLLTLLTLLASCGSDVGAPPLPSTGVAGGNGQENIKDSEVVPEEIAACNVSFTRNDKLETVALKAHRARVECKLTEDQVVKMVGKSRS